MWRAIASVAAIGVLLAGCSGQGGRTASSAPPTGVVSPSPSTSSVASPGSVASASAVPTSSASPSESIPPTAIPVAEAESILRVGIRKDASVGCTSRTTGLPSRAVAGVDCRPATHLVTSVDFYLFTSQADLLSTYLGLLSARGVQQRSGDCFGTKAGEDAYTPGDGSDGFIAAREGCYIASGKAADLVTLPGEPTGDGGYTFGGPFVLVVADGASSNPGALHTWTWLGNKAEPGAPTIWQTRP